MEVPCRFCQKATADQETGNFAPKLIPRLHWAKLGTARHGTAPVPCRVEWQRLHCNNESRAKACSQLKKRCANRRDHSIDWRLVILRWFLYSGALFCVRCRSPALLRAHCPVVSCFHHFSRYFLVNLFVARTSF